MTQCYQSIIYANYPEQQFGHKRQAHGAGNNKEASGTKADQPQYSQFRDLHCLAFYGLLLGMVNAETQHPANLSGPRNCHRHTVARDFEVRGNTLARGLFQFFCGFIGAN